MLMWVGTTTIKFMSMRIAMKLVTMIDCVIILIVIGTVQCGFIGGWCASETGLISFKTMVRRSSFFLGFHDSGDGNSFDNR
jgi:hypothetical protein